jgi:hypothetical protein
MPAASTPGIARDGRKHLLEDGRAFLNAGLGRGRAVVVVHFDGGGTLGLEAEIDIEDMEKAAQSRPAPTSSTQARATSETTRTERMRSCLRLWPEPGRSL